MYAQRPPLTIGSIVACTDIAGLGQLLTYFKAILSIFTPISHRCGNDFNSCKKHVRYYGYQKILKKKMIVSSWSTKMIGPCVTLYALLSYIVSYLLFNDGKKQTFNTKFECCNYEYFP